MSKTAKERRQEGKSSPKTNLKDVISDPTKIYIRSPKRINNRTFDIEVDNLRYMHSNLVLIAEKMSEIKDPSKQHLVFEDLKFKDKDGNVVPLERTTFSEKDFRALNIMFDRQLLNLKKLYRAKGSRNTFSPADFFDEENRFDEWYFHLSGQNRIAQASETLRGWLADENFGGLEAPKIGRDGKPMDESDALNKAQDEGLRNELSEQLMVHGRGIRSIFILLFYHAIRVNNVAKMAEGVELGPDGKQNYFTEAMLEHFVRNKNPSTSRRYKLYSEVKNPKDDRYENSSVKDESIVDHIIRTRYPGDRNFIYYDDEGRRRSERITEEFVHITAVSTIINLNISEWEDELSIKDEELENIYGEVISDYKIARETRDKWRSAFDENAKEKVRLRRIKKKREASSSG